MLCRHCHNTLNHVFVDLGSSPPSNAYLTAEDLKKPEKWFPLRVLVCEKCWLVQTEDFAQADELFDANYAYFSSYSTSWLKHAQNYVSQMVQRFQLGAESHVVEVASNDGYLLQYVQAAGIPCTGIEPTGSTAAAAREKGIQVVEQFFGVSLAKELVAQGKQADLTVANNVLAHVPDINDFVAGFFWLLKPKGVATFEFPHLLQLVQQNQFDTIYHEHFSYLSLTAVHTIFNANGLVVFDVEELPTHGGSLRVYAQRKDSGLRPATTHVIELLEREAAVGMTSLKFYEGFQAKAEKVKNDFLEFLLTAKRDGRRVAAYGAAAKGNTLLNFAGVRPDLIAFVCDAALSKQEKYLPGSRIPVNAPSKLTECPPELVVILPWNIQEEVGELLRKSLASSTVLVVAIPQITVLR